MAIRLCHACSGEVFEGDKVCRHCHAVLDTQSAVIEVVGDDGGFSFGTNRNAYEDESLKNFKQEHMDVQFEEVQGKTLLQTANDREDYSEDNLEEDFDTNRNAENVYNGIVDMFKNPKDYVAFLVGIVGVILMVVGMILPMYRDSIGANHYIYRGDMYYYGLFIALLNIVSIFLIFKAKHKFVIIPAIFNVALLIFFALCFVRLESFSKLGFGYYLLCFGAVTIITSAVLVGKNEDEVTVKRGDYRNKPLCKHDFIWMLVTLFVAIGVINACMESNLGLASSGAGKNSSLDSIVGKNKTTFSINLSDDKGKIDLTIVDTYILQGATENDLSAVVELELDNNSNAVTSFNDVFTIAASQNNRQLEPTDDIVTNFDLTTPTLLVGIGCKQNVYFGFKITTSNDINITMYKNKDNSMVCSKDVRLNTLYLASKDQTTNANGTPANNTPMTSSQPATDQKQPAGKSDGSNVQSAAPKSPLQSTAPNTPAQSATTKSPATRTQAPVVRTAAPTPAPTMETTWSVYVNLADNSSWNRNLYIYIYFVDDSGNADNRGVEWPGVKMTPVGNNKYKYTFSSDLIGKARFLVSDGDNDEHQYPARDEPGIPINKCNYNYTF